MHGNFVWTDLTSFDVAKAKRFYRNVVGWEFESDGSGYEHGHSGGGPRADIYEMPEFFQSINMPSFWVSYISVVDIDQVVAKANELGAKVEIEESDERGKVALIRDPAGAGFTCYEGDLLATSRSFEDVGSWCWSELFVSDLSKVETFYTELFNWTIIPETGDRYSIANQAGQRIGSIQVASKDVKGDKEFWAVFFAVQDLDKARKDIESNDGNVIYELDNSEGHHLLAYDDQGAAFLVTQVKGAGATEATATRSPSKGSSLKWRSFVGLVGIYLIVIFEQGWAWGLLFLFWVIPDLKSGITYFLEPVDKRMNPVMYWAIVLTWLGLATYMLVSEVLKYG